MKRLRIILLMLLALLLPLRGAVAAALLCPQGSHSVGAVPAPEHHQHPMHDHGTVAHHHEGAGPIHLDDAASSAGHSASCNACAAFCSMTPMLSEMPTLRQPAAARAVAFPALSVPSPTFQSGGPERPPRSI